MLLISTDLVKVVMPQRYSILCFAAGLILSEEFDLNESFFIEIQEISKQFTHID